MAETQPKVQPGCAKSVSDDFPVFHLWRFLLIQDGLRCGFAQFKLCTHFQ